MPKKKAATTKKAAASERVAAAQVGKAVRALFNHNEQHAPKDQLLDDHNVLSLLIGMKAFPEKSKHRPVVLPLAHSLHAEGEICVFVKDPQSELKARLEASPIEGVVKVIGISKLKAKYKTFESKRQLCDSYDLFLADKRIVPMLPKLLGKEFFRKKRLPLPIAIEKKSDAGLRTAVDAARTATTITIGDGSCAAVRVGHTGMEEEEVVANVMAVLVHAVRCVPGNWSNVQSLHLKTTNSVALPIYSSLPGADAHLMGTELPEPKVAAKRKKP